jgi:hypothetical protein
MASAIVFWFPYTQTFMGASLDLKGDRPSPRTWHWTASSVYGVVFGVLFALSLLQLTRGSPFPEQ